MSSQLILYIVFSVVIHRGLGTVNFALRKYAVQSTTLSAENFLWTAEKAVDGNTSGSNPDNSMTCSATSPNKSANHTWEVSIGFQIIVKTVTVYGRTDRYFEQLRGFKLYIGNESGSWTYNQELQSFSSSNSIYVFKPNDDIASFISLIKLGGMLVICEVTVDGECLSGNYSKFCNLTCGACYAYQPCDKENGTCPMGCDKGWTGSLCKEGCNPGKYGFNCNETCGNCLYGNTSCNTSYGYCNDGCQAGWQGDDCKTGCNTGEYGNNCNETCGNCLNGNISCDTLYGNCNNGCMAGWQGYDCKKECNAGTYGFTCSETCGYCLYGNNSCLHIYGQCPDGCQSGWKGETCKSGCERGNYSYNCNETCGHCLYGNSNCSTSDGNCTNGCLAGWQGYQCNRGCDRGTFGYKCNETCGHCLNGNSSCSTSDGNCTNGCLAGWQGYQCNRGCEPGNFGYNCNETCGHCFNDNISCSTSDGNCTNGCLAGWQGYQCNIDSLVKLPETAIESSILGGSVGGAVSVVVLLLIIVIIIFTRRRIQKRSASGISRGMDDGNVYENSMDVALSVAIGSLSDDGDFIKGNNTTAMPTYEKMTKKLHSENSETYYNLLKYLPNGMVSLSHLWDYVQEKCLDEKHFAEEFQALPSGPQLPTNIALHPENRKKNRYKDLYAYDVNRVQLKPLGNDESDYINASFVDGYSTQRKYIASQGTTKQNLNDFWRMLWQYDVEKIVMLTGLFEGGKHKCELYWPEEEGETSTFGIVSVTFLDSDIFADYAIRTLEMSVGNKSQRLTQFHYTAWPDKGVPRASSSVVLFWNRVNREPTNTPIVVHCSAGIGRTGTYIALDILVHQGRVEGNVNVSECVSNIRRQRVNMVQTKEQYIFLHETLVEALMLSGTDTASDKFPNVFQELLERDGESGKLKLQLEYERLTHEDENHETVYASISTENDLDEAESQDEFADAKKPENKAKNRYNNILP
ncbi:hypothetical protein ACJMK2_032034, partial [Sinanodonta woodiana]